MDVQAPKIPLNYASAPRKGGLPLGSTATDSFHFSVIPPCTGVAAAAVVRCSTNGFIPPKVFGWEGSKVYALPEIVRAENEQPVRAFATAAPVAGVKWPELIFSKR